MAKDLEKKTNDDLLKVLSEKREALRNFRFAIEGSKTRNVREGRTNRREIARIMTELNGRLKAENK